MKLEDKQLGRRISGLKKIQNENSLKDIRFYRAESKNLTRKTNGRKKISANGNIVIRSVAITSQNIL